MRHVLACLLVSSLISATSSGCFIYFDDDDDDCEFGGGIDEPAPAVPAVGLRNPETGQCEFFGGSPVPSPINCDDPSEAPPPIPGGGPTPDPAPAPPPPSWGFCESACTGLEEEGCLDTVACRGIYDEEGTFRECWAVDQSGPISGGTCAGLDGLACSRHDDCVAVHAECNDADRAPGFACGIGEFISCEAEPTGNPPLACAAVSDEVTCIDRAECTPLYQGVDCTCDPLGCGCADWVFEGCQ